MAAFGLPLDKVFRNLVKLGRRKGSLIALRALPVTLPANRDAQNAVIGLARAATDRAKRKQKGKKPLRGIPRAAATVDLGLTKGLRVATGSTFKLFGELVRGLDTLTDVVLGPGAEEIVDIPEELVRDAIDGILRVNDELLKQKSEVLTAQLRR